jgi:predicted sulfurtransferase
MKGRAIVVYHTDDKQSAHYATLLVEKGWEEVWIIEGGFLEYMHSYPEGVDES